MKFRFAGILLIIFLTAFPLTVIHAQNEKRHSAAWDFNAGENYLQKRDWQAALDAFNSCLQKDPRFIDAYYSRGLVKEHFNKLEEAVTDYNIYLEFRPDHYEALFSRAQARLRLNQYGPARTDFIKLLHLPTGETTTVFFRQDAYTEGVNQIFTSKGSSRAYLLNYIGLTETQLNNFKTAVTYFDSAIHQLPSDPDFYVNRGTAFERNRDTLSATRDYQKALSIFPSHGIAKHNLAVLTGRNKKQGGASALIDEVIEGNPTLPFAYAERAFSRMENGDYQLALSDYSRAIEIDSTKKDYFMNRGLVREKLKDVKGAFADFTKAIALDEKFAKAWLNRGNLLTRMGKLHDAIEDYTAAITYSPDYSTAYFNRAIALDRLRQKEAACKDLTLAESLGTAVAPRMKQKICQGR